MSVTICADGDFKEQADELLRYIAREKAEAEQEAFVSSFALDGDKSEVINRIVGEVKDLGAGNEKETEGFFNLLLAVILSAHSLSSSDFASLYPQLLLAVTASPSRQRAQYQVLSNLHNLLPSSSSLRLPTISALVDIAAKNGDLSAVALSPSLVKTWLGEWEGVSDEQKAEFVEKVASSVAQTDENASYPYRLLLLSLPTASSSSIISTLTLALRLPQILSFDSLLASPALASPPAEASALLALVKVFQTGTLADFRAWAASNGSAAQGLDLQALEKKVRLLTLVGLCAKQEQDAVSYAVIAAALEVDEKDVEVWVIDAIRLKLIAAKLSQPTRSVRVQRAYIRSFGSAEWATLQGRLAAWDDNLANVEQVVTEAKQIGEGFQSAGGPSSRPE